MTNSDPWTAAQGSRIDWPKVLDDIAYLLGEPLATNELLREPVSVVKLADALDYPRGTVRNWQDGSEPKHFDGERILAYWCRLTGKARTFVPVDRYVYSAAKAGTPKPREKGEHGSASELKAALRTSRVIEGLR